MASLHPDQGARMVLTRSSVDERAARYTVDVYAPNEVRFTSEARFSTSEVTFEEWSEPPPDWVATFLERFAKGLARKHAAKQSWPRKLTRWRG